MSDEEKKSAFQSRDDSSTNSFADPLTPEEEKSIGVLKAEILAKQWDTWYYKLILLISAFLTGYAYGLDSQVRYVLTAFATQSYAQHSLISTIGIVSGVAGAVCQPIYARLSDVFGRLEIFLVAIVFYVVGTIIQCQATNVQKYAAGDVFYTIGYSGVLLTVLFIVSDFSSLKWRLFYNLTPAFPYIINSWISGNVKAAYGSNWKWGIGMWAFTFPLACIPLVCCMIHMRWKAGKTEEWRVFKERKTKYQELGAWGFAKWLFWSLDIIGLILVIVSFGCLLVPLTLAGGTSTKWRKHYIIVPIIIGGLLFPVLGFWESKTKHAIAPFHLLKDRGVWSALVLSFFIDFIFGIESTYLYTVLRVAVNESDLSATRISFLGSFVSTVGGLFFSLLVVRIRRLKPFIIFGTCMWMVGFGLMLKYRSGLGAHSGVIGSQFVYGFGSIFFQYPVLVLLQSCISHEHMAVILSLAYTLYRLGNAVGNAISGAIWSQKLYPKILQYVGDPQLAAAGYAKPYDFIAAHPWGTETRNQFAHAYRDVQFILVLVALCLCVPMIAITFFLRDNKLGNEQSYGDLADRAQGSKFDWNFFSKKKSSEPEDPEPVEPKV